MNSNPEAVMCSEAQRMEADETERKKDQEIAAKDHEIGELKRTMDAMATEFGHMLKVGDTIRCCSFI